MTTGKTTALTRRTFVGKVVSLLFNMLSRLVNNFTEKYLEIDGKQWKQCQTLFFWAPKSLQMVTAAMKLKDTYSWKESYDQPRQHIKKQRHYFVNKGPSSQGYAFSSSQVWM